MTGTSSEEDPRFADLLDDLLTAMLDGDEPDLAAIAARHPAVAHRVDEAVQLVGGVPGRRTSARPSLQGYEIVREIGRGGMGTVYLARQLELDREVALKVLPHSIGLSPRSRPRFLAEARALAKVEHDHIVGIHRIVDEGEVLAFEMEYVDGPSLQQLLDHLRTHRQATGTAPTLAQVAERLQLPLADLGARNLTQFFVRLAAKIASALGAVHQAGLIHRDVKPANILLRRNGQAVLVDFGLVRLTGREISRSGSFAGTPVYSAPEQLRGDTSIGPTADVYGLGVTLYECLTLSTPFAGRTTTDQLRRIEEGRCQPLRRAAPGIPRDLDTIVAHAMEVDGARRYQHANAFADDLQRLLDLQPIQAAPVGRLRRCGKFLRRHRNTLLAGSLGAAVVAVAVMPMLGNVEAASRRRQQAAQYVRAAQQQLFAIESRHLARHAVGRTGATADDLRPGRPANSPMLAAIGDYDRALALDPDLATAQRERDVVRLAVWLQQLSVGEQRALQQALDGEQFRGITARLGPITIAAARRLAIGTRDPNAASESVEQAADGDRTTAGLLGYLIGDFPLCERAWQDTSALQDDEPLVNAALGMLYLGDGMPDRAYSHLHRARQSFPDSALLGVALTEAALANGDLRVARSWCATIAGDDSVALVRRRLELDLRAASGDERDLDTEYRQLARLDPADPTPRHRIAQLAQRRGELDHAARVLDDLIDEWPEDARFRLDRTRVALQMRDLGAYAQQALAVLAMDYGHQRSHGTQADLLEILRIGGLADLYREGMERTGTESTGRAFVGGEIPIRSFVPPAIAASYEPLLRQLHAVRTDIAAMVGRVRLFDRPEVKTLLGATLLAARLQGIGGIDLRFRLAMVCAPMVAELAAQDFAALMRHLTLLLPGGVWTEIEQRDVAPPVDLSPLLRFGHAMCRIDDWSGDGLDDVLVSAPSIDVGEAPGRVFVLDGRDGEVLATMIGDSPDHGFGYSLASIGDVDGDGADDWLIGAPAFSATARTGRVELWSGRKPERIDILEGGQAFGVATTGLGDIDGDDTPDFAVATAPLLRNTAPQGLVQVFSGRSRQVLRTLRNDVPGVWFGACITDAGDFDGDGHDDIVVGGNYGGAPGLVRIYSAVTGAVLQSFGDAEPEHGFGFAVVGAGDVDGDRVPDIVVSSRHGTNTAGVDRVQIFSGRTGAVLTEIPGSTPGRDFGFCVAPYRPQHGPMMLAIGSPMGGAAASGSVEFWTSHGEPVSTLLGPLNVPAFGACVLPVPDTDGDGRPELFLSNQMGKVQRISSRQMRFAR